MTTYAEFVSGLSDLNVSTVKRKLDEPPSSLSTADLPCQWVQLPQGIEGPMTFQANGGWPELRAQFVVAYESAGQGTQAENWAGTIALMDYVAAALRSVPSGFCKGKVTWNIRAGQVPVGDNLYWAVVADVVGHG